MGQYWTRKNDQEDQDRNTFSPWTEKAMKEDRNVFRTKTDSSEPQESRNMNDSITQ